MPLARKVSMLINQGELNNQPKTKQELQQKIFWYSQLWPNLCGTFQQELLVTFLYKLQLLIC